MIIDQNGVFFDDAAVAAEMTSAAVSFQPYAGREDPVYLSLLVQGANASAVSLAVDLEQSADKSAYTSIGSLTLAKADALPATASLRLPAVARDKYLRLSVKVSGPASGLTLFAAVTRDHFAPYDEGLYINKGLVQA